MTLEDLVYGNVAELLDDDVLRTIGAEAKYGHEQDLQSRAAWESTMAESLKIAEQVKEEKTFPWEGASNIQFPLVALACVNFQSRAAGQMVPSPYLIECEEMLTADMLQSAMAAQMAQGGEDVQDPQQLNQRVMQAAVAQRKLCDAIGRHMSFQMLEQDDYEDKMDQLFTILPLTGCVVKETFFDPYTKQNTSEVILPQNFVADYWLKGDLEEAQRVGKRFYLTLNEIEARVREGRYIEGVVQAEVRNDGQIQTVVDERQGQSRTTNTVVVEMVAQHTWLDLDEDGYEEPYIVVFEAQTGRVRSIRARFDISRVQHDGDRVTRIVPFKYFTKYELLKSMDGGWYGMGFGQLLGNINDAVSSTVNRLLDAGTLELTSGGFLSREVKIKGGDYGFSPMEWKRTDSTAQVLKDGIVPLPVRGPNPVLMQLLEYLVGYAERVAGAVETVTGMLPGQNTPAETSRNAMDQGLTVYKGVVRRVFRSMVKEFRIWFDLNQRYYFGEPGGMVPQGAYQSMPAHLIRPAADVNAVSDSVRLTRAKALLEVAMSGAPGEFNMYEVKLNLLKALKVSTPDRYLPDPAGPLALPKTPPAPMQIEQMKGQTKIEVEKIKAGVAQNKLQLELAKLLQEADKTKAQIELLEAQAQQTVSDTQGAAVRIATHAANTELAMAKARHEGLLKSLELLHKIEVEDEQRQQSQLGSMAGDGGDQGAPGASGESGQGAPGGHSAAGSPDGQAAE